MKKHLLLIGFSCTGKTSLGSKVFKDSNIIDSDKEIRNWIKKSTDKQYEHIYNIYMDNGRDHAIGLIEQAEEELITRWAIDQEFKIISLGPGFPFRKGWPSLRKISNVILFRRPPEGIYKSLIERREGIFKECPEAKQHDNWDIGVIVNKHRVEYERREAISNITAILDERERYYKDNDAEINTDNWERAKARLQEIWKQFSL